ncbi:MULTISPECIES: pantoate--beta-alanine ligase [Pseudomonas]|uniref:pantoate--beta-alanine ligase n=1 Tax=Pseudomonas TaxID=286 RepID=UPI002DBD4EA7|nr:pantoate--beta-alanine ligase [Pseudomonas asiatica]MEB6590635.1 pantoate--beta-alanine ligase [Pseudomonas asiatica]
MLTVDTIKALQARLGRLRAERNTIALVATMGNLHDGHIALIELAKQKADVVVVSIFVNPLQFGLGEDLASYPRTLQADKECLAAVGCDVLFAPTVEQMYPDGMHDLTLVRVPRVAQGLCGGSRPGHFDGMATVVMKLLNIIQPDVAIFGEKDYQQLAVIRAMVRDLNISTQIVGAPTVRAQDGLALSSRNGYLSESQRSTAPLLHKCLVNLASLLKLGQDIGPSLTGCRQRLESAGFEPEYLEVRNAQSLEPATRDDDQWVIMVAARLGQTRLIDNLVIKVSEAAVVL